MAVQTIRGLIVGPGAAALTLTELLSMQGMKPSIVEREPKDSRQLGKVMFLNSTALSAIRNWLLPYYNLQRMLTNIAKVMDGK